MAAFFAEEISHLLSKKETEKIGVIDIGSNSVRLVVYDGLKRTPLPLFNEKVLCGLAKEMAKTGRLNQRGAEKAKKAIARFVVLAKNMGVNNLTALATAAMRIANDGKEFKEGIEKEHDIKVRIISGEEESKFSTLGVLASIAEPDGVVGDLGGGSLELSCIKKSGNNYKVDGFQSFPIGPLQLKGLADGSRARAEEIIDKNIADLAVLKENKGKNFYAVGGGFRALAKIHIEKTGYPLRVLHNYIASTKEFHETVQNIAKMPPSRIKSIPLPQSRAETIAFTALVAERIITHYRPEKFIFSVHGLREGYLYEKLPEEIQNHDALISGCCDLINHISTDNKKNEWPQFGYELFEWMSPLFKDEEKKAEKLRLAACILSRMSWYEHTEYRAEMAFRTILDSSISGLTHEDRVFLATCVYHRYKTAADLSVTAKIHKLINRNQMYKARSIGMALRLGIILSGAALGVLGKTKMRAERGRITIEVSGENRHLIGENVERRLAKLADILGMEARISAL